MRSNIKGIHYKNSKVKAILSTGHGNSKEMGKKTKS